MQVILLDKVANLGSLPENAYFGLWLKTEHGKNTRFLP